MFNVLDGPWTKLLSLFSYLFGAINRSQLDRTKKQMIQERTLPAFDATNTKISQEEGLLLYEDLVLGRSFEDMCAQMYYRGKMFGFVHLYNGQEAVSTGVIKAMRQDEDFVCSTYRDHVHALSAGVSAREVMAELFGKATGCCGGRGGSRVYTERSVSTGRAKRGAGEPERTVQTSAGESGQDPEFSGKQGG